MDNPTLPIVSLCTGIGGLDLGVHAALRKLAIRPKTVCYIERGAEAQAILLARMEEAALEPAPIWDDVCTFPGEAFHGVVGLVAAGIPCQGNSLAGNRKLEADPRNLWPATRRLLRELGSPLFFLENVPGIAIPGRKRGLPAPIARICGELAEDGYDTAWVSLRADEVGASHRRERFFLLAHRVRDGCRELCEAYHHHGEDAPGHIVDGCNPDLADAVRTGEAVNNSKAGKPNPHRSGEDLADAAPLQREEKQRSKPDGVLQGLADPASKGLKERWVEQGPQERAQPRRTGRIMADPASSRHTPPAGRSKRAKVAQPGQPERRGEDLANPDHHRPSWAVPLRDTKGPPRPMPAGTGCFAPGPGDPRWPAIIAERPDLAPTVESSICRVVDGISDRLDGNCMSRVDQLRALGNACVRRQACRAFLQCWDLLGLPYNGEGAR